jgi:hypothetical protein
MSGPSEAESPFGNPPPLQDPWAPAPLDPYAVGKNSEGGIVTLPPPPVDDTPL